MSRPWEMRTKRGYAFAEVSSAMQKAIRRADARLAGFWAIELFESGYYNYVWKRLFTISAEDCGGIITQEIDSLHKGFCLVNDKSDKTKGRIFIVKAVLILCEQPKSRDSDHLTNLIYDRQSGISDEQLLAEVEATRAEPYVPIPEYAFDVHTKAGRVAGKTKKEFFVEEQDALKPKQIGLFDQDLENVRSGKVKM